MAKKNPFEDAMEELSNILHQVNLKQHELKEDVLPEGLEDRVKKLKEFIEEFKGITEGNIKKAGENPQRLLNSSSWAKELSTRDQKTMESLEQLKKEISSQKSSLESQIEKIQNEGVPYNPEKKHSESANKKSVKKRIRKKKFRGLGGDDWVKM